MKSPPIPRALSPLSSLSIPLSPSPVSLSLSTSCMNSHCRILFGMQAHMFKTSKPVHRWRRRRQRQTSDTPINLSGLGARSFDRNTFSRSRKFSLRTKIENVAFDTSSLNERRFFYSAAIWQRSHLTAKWEIKTFEDGLGAKVQLQQTNWLTNVNWKSGIETFTLKRSLKLNSRVVISIYPNASKPP